MIIITRDTAKLRPARGANHCARHPGIVVHCTGGVRPTSVEHALERWRTAQHGHMAPKRLVEVEQDDGRKRLVNKGGNGWADLGYHFGITPTGEVLEGRGWKVLGAHAGKGYNKWLGIVVLGKGTDITEDEQVAIQSIYAEHLARGGGPKVIPHNAVSSKRCPGPAVTAWLRQRFPEAS